MKKNRKALPILGLIAGLCAVALLAWAISWPFLERRRASEQVERADAILSLPLENRIALDAVDCDTADAILREVLDRAPSNGRARRLAPLASGCSALNRGDAILAEGALRNAAQQLPSDPRPARWMGSLALMLSNPEAAEGHFNRALKVAPDHLPSRIGRSDALAELGRPEEALTLLDQIEAGPLGLIELRRGMLLETLGRFDEAAGAYESAMELSPERAEPRNNLAALERERGNLERAWDLQLEAVERSPDDPVILLNGGLIALAVGQDERAEELLSRAAELDRESADPARALADHLLLRGEPDRAIEVLGPAVERFPRDAALRNSLGNALAAAGRASEARAAYRRAIQTAPALAEPHNGLAVLLMASGELDEARAELERALDLDPSNDAARQNLAEIRRRQARRELASL